MLLPPNIYAITVQYHSFYNTTMTPLQHILG